MSSNQAIDDPKVEDFVKTSANLHLAVSPNVLYHYTSQGTFRSILENRCLWMSYVLHMNDSTEFSHGMDLFKTGLDQLEQMGVTKEWLDRVRPFFDDEKKGPLAAPFVFSTTHEKDQATHWNGFGDSGRGVAIGLKADLLPGAMDTLGGPLPVIYDTKTQTDIVNQVVTAFVQLVGTLGKKIDDTGYIRELTLAYFRAAYIQSIRFKAQSWEHEQEWRYFLIVKQGHPQIKTRIKDQKTNSYFHLDIPALKDLIVNVTVGPNAEQETRPRVEALKSITELTFGISESQVKV